MAAGIRFSPPRVQKPAVELANASTDSEPSMPVAGEQSSRRWVVVTKDFSGLGLANRLDQEGEDVVVVTDYDNEDDPKCRKRMEMVGEGWLKVMPLSEAVNTLQSDNTYWIFAENCFVDEARALLKAGQKVFPKSIELSEKMEHDRNYGTEIAEQYGLEPPVTHEFTSKTEAMTILEANPTKAYVMKLDDNKFNYQTCVPNAKKDEDANRQVYDYLTHMKGEPGSGILQERIPLEEGLEANVEFWYSEGMPFLATLGLEVKRKNTYDLGEMAGCGGDFMQFIPMDCELVKMTVELLRPFYEEQKYTGFADVNVIITKDNVPHFLEVCNRFGYNSHPNMFLGLAKESFANIMEDFINGNVDGIRDCFRDDIGCSLTMFIDHPREGLPVHVKAQYEDVFYPFDGYKEDGQLLMTGYSDEIGIVMGHGKTIEAAWKEVSEAVAYDEAVIFPDCYYRWDLASDNYYNAPVLRYRELQKRGLIP